MHPTEINAVFHAVSEMHANKKSIGRVSASFVFKNKRILPMILPPSLSTHLKQFFF